MASAGASSSAGAAADRAPLAAAGSVFLHDVRLGAAPVVLPAPQVAQLLGPGDILALEADPRAAAAAANAASSSSASTTGGGGGSGGGGGLHDASAQRAGVVWLDDGSVRLERAARYTIVHATTASGSKSTLRTAQYICGIVGIVIVNFVLLYDVADRGANAKDFLINFASDILAVGAVLFIAELVDRARSGGRAPTGHRGQGAQRQPLYDSPVTAAAFAD